MIRKLLRTVIILAVLSVIALCSIPALSESGGLDSLLNGKVTSPLQVTFSSPQFLSLARFDSERLETLNRLIRHFALEIRADGELSETTVAVDGDPLYTVKEDVSDGLSRSVYSFEPDHVYERPLQETGSTFERFLGHQFFPINGMLDELYPMFEKAASAFQEFSKTSDEKVNYRDFGKSVRRVTITFQSEYVREHFPQALAGLAGTGESGRFLSSLLFSGTQKIVLCFRQDNHILRVNYDGVIGMTEDSMRRVSVSWRCIRDENRKKDEVTLKSPAVKGFDRYNLSYARELTLEDPEKHAVSWDFQLDLKSGDEKKKVRYSADLSFSGDKLTGQAVYSERQEREENRITINPEIRKENESEYSGTIEITDNSGKIMTSSITSALRISPCGELSGIPGLPATATDIRPETGENGEEEITSAMDRILIRKLLTLPAEDLEFLNRDIPRDVWKSIIQTMF